MIFIRRLVSVISLFCLMIVFCSSALAADYQSVVEKTMKNKLLEHGMSVRIATRLANENAFIGMVMLRGIEKVESKELATRAQAVGDALGNVIGAGYLSYGEKDIPLVTAAMMNAVRAGISPLVLSEMFKAMAKNDYPISKTVSLMHDVSEATKNSGLRDYGAGLCKNIEMAAIKKRPYGDLQKQIVLAAKLQKVLTQQSLLAQAREAEQLKKKIAQANAKKMRNGNDAGGSDRKSTGMAASSGLGSQPGKGGTAAASSGSASSGSASSGSANSGSANSGSANSGSASSGTGDSSGSASSGTGDSSGSASSGSASSGTGDSSGSASSGTGDSSGSASSGTGDSSGSANSGSNGDAASGGSASDGAGNTDTK